MELEKEVLLPMIIFIKKVLLGTCTGISFVDSTPLRVCRNQRILIHKTFEGLAERGKCSMGWFFGFKLHLIINDNGEILNFMFTPGNVDDQEPLKQSKFLENIKGKLCADNELAMKLLNERCLEYSICAMFSSSLTVYIKTAIQTVSIFNKLDSL